MDGHHAEQGVGVERHQETHSEHLVRIEEQGRQTLELVRALIGMLMPKEGAREGPTLEELLATLIMQQREMIALERGIQANVLELPKIMTPLVARAVLDMLGPKTPSRQ